MIFGVITCVTGLLGVVIGAATTRLFRQKTERADPLVCAVSMLGSAIFICLIFVVAKKSIVGAYVRTISCNWYVCQLRIISSLFSQFQELVSLKYEKSQKCDKK